VIGCEIEIVGLICDQFRISKGLSWLHQRRLYWQDKGGDIAYMPNKGSMAEAFQARLQMQRCI